MDFLYPTIRRVQLSFLLVILPSDHCLNRLSLSAHPLGEIVIPDLTGMTMRQAGETLAKSELHFDFSGSGLVNQQSPQAGKIVTRGATVEVKFSPLTP